MERIQTESCREIKAGRGGTELCVPFYKKAIALVSRTHHLACRKMFLKTKFDHTLVNIHYLFSGEDQCSQIEKVLEWEEG